MFAIGIGGCGAETSGLDSPFAFDGIEADEVEGDVLENRQVMRSVSCPDAYPIIGESDIHALGQAIFHRPMGTMAGSSRDASAGMLLR